MAKRDRVVLESFVDFLCAHLANFSTLPKNIQFHFADLAFRLEQKRFRHNKFDGYAFLPFQEIYSKFGRKFLTINESLGFFSITKNWSKKDKHTRGVKLSAQVSKIKTYFLRSDPLLSELICETGKRLRTLPSNGLADISITNRKNTYLKAVIPINHRAINRLIKQLKAVDLDIGLDVAYLLNAARTIKHYSSTKLAGENNLIQRYHESKAGRLYASGVNLQNAPKLIKNAALSGCWEHDFDNCHYAIFLQLAARTGQTCTAMQHYIANKTAVRAAIADDVGITIKQVKICLLALMYGARESTWHDAAISQIIGSKAQELYQHPFFAKFSEEINKSRKQIISLWPNQNQRSIINAMGKPISKKDNDRFIMAHIQQGLEARMLHISISHCHDQILLLQHDGFSTLSKIDCSTIICQISEVLGFDMQITSKMHQVQITDIKKVGQKNTMQVLTNTETKENAYNPILSSGSSNSRFQSEFFQ